MRRAAGARNAADQHDPKRAAVSHGDAVIG
jgi:hypothetical protein